MLRYCTDVRSQNYSLSTQRRTNELLLLNKKDLRTHDGLFTGHCPLKYYLRTYISWAKQTTQPVASARE